MKKRKQPSTGATAAAAPPDAVVFDLAQDMASGTWLPSVRGKVRSELGQPGTGPSRTEFSPYDVTGWDWAPWGIDNRFPTLLREKIESVPIGGQAIYRLMQMMYGSGIAYYRRSDLYRDGANVQRVFIPEVEDFLRRSFISTKWLPAQFLDFRLYANAFSELIFSEDKSQVVRIWHKQAEHSRLSKQNLRNFRVEYLLYTPLFVSDVPKNDQIQKIPLMQCDDEAAFLDRVRGYKIAWHSYMPTPGKVYYARAPWLGLFRKNGWIDAAEAVPEVVNAMMRNQIRLKYQIIVHIDYFKARHPRWDEYTVDEREKLIDGMQATIDDTLVGTDKAYRSIVSIFGTDAFGRDTGKIEIVAIDDKTKKDDWVPSSTAADAQIVQGLGYSPTMMGLASERGSIGAGSGSDKREMFNILTGGNTVEQNIILEPLNWIAAYNARTNPEWDIVFFIDNSLHTTTNQREDGIAASDTALNP